MKQETQVEDNEPEAFHLVPEQTIEEVEEEEETKENPVVESEL